jgi:hypothetical protein
MWFWGIQSTESNYSHELVVLSQNLPRNMAKPQHRNMNPDLEFSSTSLFHTWSNLIGQNAFCRHMSLDKLAYALWARFKQTHQLKDMEEAVMLYHKALCLWPCHHVCLLQLHINLICFLLTQFNLTGKLEDLEEIDCLHPTRLPRCCLGSSIRCSDI